jgi:hypothetical protein
VLLGPIQYLASFTKDSLSPATLDKLRVWMEAASTSGMDCGSKVRAEYIIKHAKSIGGRELKIWAQLASVCLAPLVAQQEVKKELWKAWFAAGELTRLLFIEAVEEEDREAYFVSLPVRTVGKLS